MAEFECRLKKYRQMKDLTQEQLAEKVDVRRETIMRLEKAQYNPSMKLAIDISRVVEAPIEEIFIPASNEPSDCLRDAEHLQAFGDCREGQIPRPLGRGI